MSVAERYCSAVHAQNLRHDLWRKVPIDTVHAVALVGRRHDLAVSLWRVLAGDRREIRSTAEHMARLIMRERRKNIRTWPGISLANARVIARTVLSCWLRPACPACSGRGYTLIPGTPTLSDTACEYCGGNGVVNVREHLRNYLGEYTVDPGLWLLGELGSVQNALTKAIFRVGG